MRFQSSAMHVVVVAVLLCGIISQGVYGADADVVLSEIRRLDGAVLSHRRDIRSGHVRIAITRRENGVASGDVTIYNIYRDADGSLLRQDTTLNRTTHIQCLTNEYLYSWSDGVPNGKGALSMVAVRLETTPQSRFYDFRKLMFMPTWFEGMANRPLESIVNSPDRVNCHIDNADYEGVPAVRVAFDRSADPISYQYWVLSNRDYNIVRMEAQVKVPNGRAFEDSVAATLQQCAGGIWFPKTIQYRRNQGGKEVKGQDIEIQVESLNQPLSSQVFDPISMGVPANTFVSKVPKDPRGDLKWDGKQILPMSAEDKSRMFLGTPPEKPGVRRSWLMAVSGILAILAAAIVYRSYLRRPSKPGSVD